MLILSKYLTSPSLWWTRELLFPFARCRTHESGACTPAPLGAITVETVLLEEVRVSQSSVVSMGELSPLFICHVTARTGGTCVGVSSPLHLPKPETGRIAGPEVIKAELSLPTMNWGVAPTPTLSNTIELVL